MYLDCIVLGGSWCSPLIDCITANAIVIIINVDVLNWSNNWQDGYSPIIIHQIKPYAC